MCADDSSAEGSCGGYGWEGAEWAGALRDRLLAATYSRLFTWLINAVNDAIKVRPQHYTHTNLPN